jgi:very-short-patch-repair endonuclease
MTAAPHATDPIDALVRQTVEGYRRKLLDLTSRNPLISFKHSERSKSQISVVDEIPEVLFAKLLTNKSLSFLPLPEPLLVPSDEQSSAFLSALSAAKKNDEEQRTRLAELGPAPSERQLQRVDRELRNRLRQSLGWKSFSPTVDPKARALEVGVNPDYELPRIQARKSHTDSKIQTLFFKDDLERKLSGLREAARVLLQDAGLSALYCAFGFLEYYESESSDELRVAPLVFVPVELDRQLERGEYTYFLRGRNEDTQTNAALRELLATQHSIELPEWDEDEEQLDPLEGYFAQVEESISEKKGWKVRRKVTVGLFTFSTLAMYNDLDPKRWQQSPLEKQEIVRSLIAGTEIADWGNLQANEYEIDKANLPEALLITEADSSQQSAIIDVLSGKNCVIQGPPGTGKSQTITNIISSSLNAGKTVLFVAEKMAALQVVKKRLDAAGLDEFCFEVHSSKTAKTAVVDSLNQRLAARKPSLNESDLQNTLVELNAAKESLLYYAEKANEQAGDTGLSIREVLLRGAIRESWRDRLPKEVASVRLENALAVTPHKLRQLFDAASNVAKHAKVLEGVGGYLRHPWRGVGNSDLRADEIPLLIDSLERVVLLCRTACSISETKLQAGNKTISELEVLINAISNIAAIGPLAEIVLPRLSSPHARDLLNRAIQIITSLCQTESRLQSVLHEAGKYPEPELLETVAGLAVSANVQDLNVSEVHDELRRKESELQKNVSLNALSQRLCSAFSISNSDIRTIKACFIAAQSLLKIDPALLELRFSKQATPEALQTLQRGRDRKRAFDKIRSELGNKIQLDLLPAPAETKDLGLALKSANLISALFDSDCRRANKLLKAALKCELKGREARGNLLIEYSLNELQISDFKSDKELSALLGSNFDGVRTDFDRIVSLLDWQLKTSVDLRPFGEAGLALDQFLKSAPIPELQQLLALSSDSRMSDLSALLETLRDETKTIDEYLAVGRTRISHVARIAELSNQLLLSAHTRLADIEQIARVLRERNDLQTQLEQAQIPNLLEGVQIRTSVPSLAATLQYAETIGNSGLTSHVEALLFAAAANLAAMKEDASQLAKGISELRLHWEQFKAKCCLDETAWLGVPGFEAATLQNIVKRGTDAIAAQNTFLDYLEFVIATSQAKDLGLGGFLIAFEKACSSHEYLCDAVEYVIYHSAAEQILNSDAKLKRHSGSSHEQLRSQYRELENSFLHLRKKLLRRTLFGRLIPSGQSFGRVSEYTELGLIQHLSTQTRPRIPLRDLFKRAGKAIQQLKPCWMMSPMSVAQFFGPGHLSFDLVVMDEASQIRPEEALGSVIRGKQIVVVGDQMQLPPTSFFETLASDSGPSDDEDFVDVKQESILEAAGARFAPIRDLRWHYRSEHGSLIDFSNREFYFERLTVFPSPFHEHRDYGVRLVHVDGAYKSGTNSDEADAVVEAAKQFMNDTPDRSLGIVAVNSKQAELIRERLDRVFASDPFAEAYRARWQGDIEELFVKNLENVQGDERDVIFISTVYGKDPTTGKFNQRFGPINGDYGFRRLNVLFTRAKKSLVVFSSIIPEEIQDEGKKRGVGVLKRYLQYARDGHWQGPESQGYDFDSEFERWVAGVLQSKGYEVVPQLGFAGYRIDMAVRNPQNPGTFLCGIECDGATYHSARSVRERDKLRQEILERLKWKIYRIWSTDWFRNPSLQTKHLLSYLEQLQSSIN